MTVDYRFQYEFKAAVDVGAVYDGDTISDVRVDLGFGVWITVDVRLANINAPELRTPTKAEGVAARDYLRGLLTGHPFVVLKVLKREKYGRALALVLLPQQDGTLLDVNKAMVESGHAVPYMVEV